MKEATFLAWLWGVIFGLGLYAASQFAIFWLSWSTPPTVADLLGTLAFAAVATILLVPSAYVVWEIVNGRFEDLVEQARKERSR